jgi:multidrug transporter EmrE-like cation transporter
MTLPSLLILLTAVGLAAVGQLMLKRGMTLAQARSTESGRSLLVSAAVSPWILAGLTVFAVSAVAWLLTLSRLPLSTAYPFNALGYLLILGASVLVLHEHTTVWTWLGTALVVVGLIVIVALTPAASSS